MQTFPMTSPSKDFKTKAWDWYGIIICHNENFVKKTRFKNAAIFWCIFQTSLREWWNSFQFAKCAAAPASLRLVIKWRRCWSIISTSVLSSAATICISAVTTPWVLSLCEELTNKRFCLSSSDTYELRPRNRANIRAKPKHRNDSCKKWSNQFRFKWWHDGTTDIFANCFILQWIDLYRNLKIWGGMRCVVRRKASSLKPRRSMLLKRAHFRAAAGGTISNFKTGAGTAFQLTFSRRAKLGIFAQFSFRKEHLHTNRHFTVVKNCIRIVKTWPGYKMKMNVSWKLSMFETRSFWTEFINTSGITVHF